MTSPVALYLAAYLAECGEPGWTPDPTGRDVVTRDGERIEAVPKMGGWVYEAPERMFRRPFALGLAHPIARGPGPQREEPPPLRPDLGDRLPSASQREATEREALRILAHPCLGNVLTGRATALPGITWAHAYNVRGRVQIVAEYRIRGRVGWTWADLGEVP